MDRMKFESPDLVQGNVEKIAALFPNCVTEGPDGHGGLKRAIDFGKLRQMLSGDVLEGDEAYEFTWVGKKAAMVEANKPTRQTLRPCPEESKNWDTTENLYIEGDNLQVLKLLQESYLGKVKMIYIDPPYNTGHDFIYKDHFEIDRDEYEQQTSMFDEDGNRNFTENTDSNPRFHSDWCSMMYSRLMLARNLLTEDGVIFISIDDGELENSRKLCDEIFGETNFITQFIWTKTSTPPSLSYKCRKTVEYILCYERQISNKRYFGSLLSGGDAPLLNTGNPVKTLCFPTGCVRFNFVQNGTIKSGQYEKVQLLDDIIVYNGLNQNAFCMKAEFKWSQDTLTQEVERGTYFIVKTDKLSVRFQRPYDMENFKTPNNFLNLELNKGKGIGTNESAVKELDELKLANAFDFPKPVSLVKYLANMITKFSPNAVIMDFFSGSATTAHAVMQLNAEDGGHRKFIMVQLPEACDEKSEAYKAGYKTICDIGKERIRRAGQKIVEEKAHLLNAVRSGKLQKGEAYAEFTTSETAKKTQQEIAETFDTGFRVFKLDDSNMRDVYFAPDDYTQDMLSMMESNIKPDRTALDLLFGCLLEWGLPLSMPYRSETINGCTVHTYNDGDLIACFDEKIPATVIEAIARRQPLRAVFRDAGFTTSPEKINLTEIFKLLAPDTRVKVI